MPLRWEPLLDGARQRVTQGIALDLVGSLLIEAGREGASATCLAESALLAHHAGLAYGDRALCAQAAQLIDAAVTACSTEGVPIHLSEGAIGIGLTRCQIVPPTADRDTDVYRELDEVVADLARDPQPYSLDLLHGLVGAGIYCLARLPNPLARETLEQIVLRLLESVRHDDRGAFWMTPWVFNSTKPLRLDPTTSTGLGVSHGVAGIVGFLGQVVPFGIGRPQAEQLLNESTSWLLAQPRLSRKVRFPRLVGPTVPADSLFGWCWGDLGIACALRIAGTCAGRRRWIRYSEALASRLAQQQDVYVKDGCLCHGMAGHAHLFNRLYQSTGRPELRAAATYWLERLLVFRHNEPGLAAFPRHFVTDEGTAEWRRDSGFLMGCAGIALVLIAATSAVVPTWDAQVLVSASN